MKKIALSKLYHIYALDTSAFYTDEEKELEKQLYLDRVKIGTEEDSGEVRGEVRSLKQKLLGLIQQNVENNLMRTVREEYCKDSNVVSLFDSALTRALGMKPNSFNDAMVIVKVYYFGVAENIIKNGFMMSGNHYSFFSASAGQIRTKKFLCVRTDLMRESWNQIACGLSVEDINRQGGVNVNKFLAYLALCNSATDIWEGFDIDRAIVVDDLSLTVADTVDYIDDRTYTIERKLMDIPLEITDGVGMVLPSLSKKNFMVRLPWIKGLLTPFPFDKFLADINANAENGHDYGIIKDIYGQEYDIKRDKIEVIFTKSQFKMWKFYQNWDDFKQKFKKFACTANKCNEEEDYIPFAKLNYQMLQTLTDFKDDELALLAEQTKTKISKMTSDQNTMLRVFGAVENNINKTPFQESLFLYPELLQDDYTREVLRELKKSLEKEAWSGRLDINGKYLFVIPDMFAYCEYLFLGKENTFGLLRKGEVYSRTMKSHLKLDCLRSPHLYREHAVRTNTAYYRSLMDKWFITDGIYVSCHDLISRLLQMDYDGDKLLVCGDPLLVRVAERNMEGIVPLYYTMAKAGATQLCASAYYDGMIAAYTGGDIGQKSNDVTKLWNEDNVSIEDINNIKILCMEGNFCVDYAKTLYKPNRPVAVDKVLRGKTRKKVPFFFQEVKDKKEGQVEPINESTVNRLRRLIPKQNLKFDYRQVGKLDARYLKSDMDFDIDEQSENIILLFHELSRNVNSSLFVDDDKNNYAYIYTKIRQQMIDTFGDENFVVDTLVDYLFEVKKTKRKVVFWECFGETVVKNLAKNLYGTTVCRKCGRRFERRSEFDEVCDDCDAMAGMPYLDPKKYRTLICDDCGKVFFTSISNLRGHRCPECQKDFKRKLSREIMQKRRALERQQREEKAKKEENVN